MLWWGGGGGGGGVWIHCSRLLSFSAHQISSAALTDYVVDVLNTQVMLCCAGVGVGVGGWGWGGGWWLLVGDTL